MSGLRDQQIAAYLDALASTAAVPGGGSAAALASAMGVALVTMVAKISARKSKQEKDRSALGAMVPELEALIQRFMELSQQDIDAYRSVIEAKKADAPAEQLERAYEGAAEVPLEAATAAVRALQLAAEISKHAWEMTASDLAVGNELIQTGLHGALGNVAINLPELRAEAAARIEHRYQQLRAVADR
jgi:formiminotetrahydrofolate cyclodeaminase